MATIETCEKLLRSTLDNVETLCIPNPEKRLELAQGIKVCFDYSIQESSEYGDISELIVADIDSESIWEQVQTRNRPLLRFLESELSDLNKRLKEKTITIDSQYQSKKSTLSPVPEGSFSSDSEQEDIEVEVSSANSEDDDEENDDDIDESKKHVSPEEEDDMENFLDEIDMAEDRRLTELENPTSHEQNNPTIEFEEDMDFVANELYDLSDDSENQESYRYEDFFGRKSSAKKSSSTKSPVRKKLETEDTSDDSGEGEGEFEDNEDDFEDEDEDEGSEGSGEGSEDEDEESKENNDEEEEEEESAAYSNQPLTTYAKEKQKLQERIAGIESELVEKKSWERRGEVKGGDRPENSLLGLAVAVERASKSTPIITPEYSKTIEDMIIEKIKASSFSNIVPQRDSVTKTQQALPDLSQERSSLGLGELYAQQFMKDSLHFDKTDEKLKESKEKLLAQFKKVCRQLDGLSHFYFAPKPEVEEFAVKPMAVASISLEDILPTTRTASTLSSSLAPEQIHEKKRGRDAAFLSAGEADRDDRQRLRRAKKAVRNKSRKAEALERGVDLTQPMKKDKRVVVAAETTNSSKSYSKSARFFSEMQKTVTADVLHRSSKDHKSAAVGGAGASSQNLKL